MGSGRARGRFGTAGSMAPPISLCGMRLGVSDLALAPALIEFPRSHLQIPNGGAARESLRDPRALSRTMR